MESLLMDYHIYGLALGIFTFLIIGLFHPLVIKAEYYFGTKSWWAFLIMGIIAAVASMFVKESFVSVLLGVVAFSSFWSILEVFEQEKRVKKGWFPANPRRTGK